MKPSALVSTAFASTLFATSLMTACKTPLRVVGPGKGEMKTSALGYTGATAVFVQVPGKDGSKDVTKRCLLPPAQAGVEIDVNGKLNVKEYGEGEFSVDDELKSLYDQSTTTLFIQMLAYRYCEVYLNGGLDAAGYAKELSKLTKLSAMLAYAEIAKAGAGKTRELDDDAFLAALSSVKETRDGLTQTHEWQAELDDALAKLATADPADRMGLITKARKDVKKLSRGAENEERGRVLGGLDALEASLDAAAPAPSAPPPSSADIKGVLDVFN